MVRLPEALNEALRHAQSSPWASLEEAFHEQGVGTEELVALVREIDKASERRYEAIGQALYVGLLLGREMGR
jgi:hypothetical protein